MLASMLLGISIRQECDELQITPLFSSCVPALEEFIS
jgi:hypothetical protein